VADDEPIYLDLADLLDLYGAVIGGTSQQARNQLRDQSGLEGALGRPRAYAYYQDADLALQGAVLAHGIAEGQTFIDGNKRLALLATLTFLELNGYYVEAPETELANWIRSAPAPRRSSSRDPSATRCDLPPSYPTARPSSAARRPDRSRLSSVGLR
jgi:death-on-curing protein